jgi:transcriptional regulator with XRE-family HTH domain
VDIIIDDASLKADTTAKESIMTTMTALRRIRFENGNRSQHRVARDTGIAQPRLSLLEHDLVDMKPEERRALAEYYGVDESELATTSDKAA